MIKTVKPIGMDAASEKAEQAEMRRLASAAKRSAYWAELENKKLTPAQATKLMAGKPAKDSVKPIGTDAAAECEKCGKKIASGNFMCAACRKGKDSADPTEEGWEHSGAKTRELHPWEDSVKPVGTDASQEPIICESCNKREADGQDKDGSFLCKKCADKHGVKLSAQDAIAGVTPEAQKMGGLAGLGAVKPVALREAYKPKGKETFKQSFGKDTAPYAIGEKVLYGNRPCKVVDLPANASAKIGLVASDGYRISADPAKIKKLPLYEEANDAANLKEGMLVSCTDEHPYAVGRVRSLEQNGEAAKIEWVTPSQPAFPYGVTNMEWWPKSDWGMLTPVSAGFKPKLAKDSVAANDARQIGLPKGGGSYLGNGIKYWIENELPKADEAELRRVIANDPNGTKASAARKELEKRGSATDSVKAVDVEGYMAGGVFHPISGSKGYSPKKAGGKGHTARYYKNRKGKKKGKARDSVRPV